MSRINVTVDSDQDWRAQAAAGLDGVAVSYRCPSCETVTEIRLQPPPWTAPAPEAGHDTLGGTDGHLRSGFGDYETARAAGELPHQDIDTITTQLWCARCQTGADATVTA